VLELKTQLLPPFLSTLSLNRLILPYPYHEVKVIV